MLHPKLKALTNKIRDKKLRKKVIELMENPTFEINGKKYSGLPLDVSPAGLSHHHCYLGGYVEHVVSTADLALAMCNSVENLLTQRKSGVPFAAWPEWRVATADKSDNCIAQDCISAGRTSGMHDESTPEIRQSRVE